MSHTPQANPLVLEPHLVSAMTPQFWLQQRAHQRQHLLRALLMSDLQSESSGSSLYQWASKQARTMERT